MTPIAWENTKAHPTINLLAFDYFLKNTATGAKYQNGPMDRELVVAGPAVIEPGSFNITTGMTFVFMSMLGNGITWNGANFGASDAADTQFSVSSDVRAHLVRVEQTDETLKRSSIDNAQWDKAAISFGFQ